MTLLTQYSNDFEKQDNGYKVYWENAVQVSRMYNVLT